MREKIPTILIAYHPVPMEVRFSSLLLMPRLESTYLPEGELEPGHTTLEAYEDACVPHKTLFHLLRSLGSSYVI